tara:strand:+ start:180 stop:740 length:561 start_codon:yes stop_codon:yes gene_type:complete
MNSFLELKKLNYSILVRITGALLIISCFFFITGCNKNLDRDRPLQAEEKRKRNIKEGRGASIGNVLGKMKGTNYEFSTSNPLWRASLDTLDFLPLSTVDYSGGVIITDWYTDNSSNKESIKISLRFLSNDVRSESLKITVHKRTCSTNQNCKTIILSDTKIKEELYTTILRKAALLEKESKKKKKN